MQMPLFVVIKMSLLASGCDTQICVAESGLGKAHEGHIDNTNLVQASFTHTS